MTRNRLLVALLAVPVLAAGCSGGADPERGAAMVFAVGDCVSVPAATPAAPEVTRAGRVSCDTDPSYTVGAIADGSGACPSCNSQTGCERRGERK
ncbi:hypothetical protein [Mycolicibacterium peregrinum]|uniref:hypothetical protein n=1 Tax=Mycolicibacterium peregrinum TaxID=43304 RepID=UPI003AB0FA1D